MNSAAIWNALGDLPEGEGPFVLSRLSPIAKRGSNITPEDEGKSQIRNQTRR